MGDAPEGQVTGLLSPFLEGLRLGKIAGHVPTGAVVLDVGCGRARILEYIPKPKRYVGVDVLYGVVEENRRAMPSCEFHLLDVETGAIPFGPGTFDAVVMGAVIEHFHDPDRTMLVLKRLLKPGGRIILTTPSPGGRLIMKAGAGTRLLSREAESEHETLLGRKELEGIARACGMRLAHYSKFLLGLNQLAVLSI